MNSRALPWTLCGLLLFSLSGLPGCSSSPVSREDRSAARQGLDIARAQLGKPYRYGGAGPRGFDCSGLVYYAYRKAGIPVPRTTSALYRNAERISLSRLRPGDLLFFRLSAERVAHVGIYAGNGRFIHAPSSGKQVAYSAMNDTYWKDRLLAAGRYH